MNPLFREIRPGGRLALFLDYDGTLVSIKSRPSRARLHPARRALLARLNRRFPVAIISGRALEEVRAMVGLRLAAYAGNHGLEIRHGGKTWTHPGAARIQKRLSRILGEAKGRLARLSGVVVEHKGISGSVHFRLARRGAKAEIEAVLRMLARPQGGLFELREGKKVIEIRPRLAWDKGTAVLKILSLVAPERGTVPLYLGDDRTDEDAFRALAGKGITVKVGERGRTTAAYRLRDVEAVWRLLRRLAGPGLIAARRPGPGSGHGE
jgi:trehalose 6-phosphate phosphatase